MKRREPPQFVLGVVEARDEQRHDLQPDPHLVQAADGRQDRFDAAAQLPVVPVVEALEIDFVEVDPGPDVVEHALGAIAVGDERGQQPRGARLLEDRDGPFARDQRLVVGRDDHARARAGSRRRPAPAATPRSAARWPAGRAAPATSPSSGNRSNAGRSRASRRNTRARPGRRERRASSRSDRTARRRRSPTARAAGRRGRSAPCRRPPRLRGSGTRVRTHSTGADRWIWVRRAPAPPRPFAPPGVRPGSPWIQFTPRSSRRVFRPGMNRRVS